MTRICFAVCLNPDLRSGLFGAVPAHAPHWRSRVFFAGLLCLALMLCAGTARAQVEVCANTAAEILNGFNIANDDAVVIKVVQGDYTLSEDPNARSDSLFFGHDITLVGGYNSNCTSRSLDPKLTTIRTNTFFSIRTRDSIRIKSIRFLDFPAGFGGISLIAMSILSGPDETIELNRVWLENSCSGNPCGTALSAFSNNVSLSQIVAVKNQTSGCAISVASKDLGSLSVLHSVLADNSGDGLCIEVWADGETDFDIFVANSIFRNNAGGQDIRTRLSPNVTLLNNIYSVLDASPAPNNSPVATLNVDPQFINPAVSAYSILNTSPAVNSGNFGASIGISEDINGGARVVGTAPDRGAYETTVLDNNLIFVTTSADQISPVPVGSLRAAINQSNSDPDLNTIRFDIAGGCPRIINLAGPLPDITDRVIVEGYSQPGSVPNISNFTFDPTICIGIRGDLSDNHAFQIPFGVGAAEYLDLSGVALGGFDVAAVRLSGGAHSRIHGVQFGGLLGSTAIANSAVNVRIGGTSRNNVVGGESNADRNLIGEAYTAGVQLLTNASGTDGSGHTIENNMIGSDASGKLSAANQVGIEVHIANNIIRDNLISGNQSDGILIEDTTATGNVVINNRIGLKASGTVTCLPPCPPDFYSLGNVRMGVLLQGGASRNTIIGNTIAYNGGKGVRLLDGQRNAVYTNSVYDNGALGIDTGNPGVNPINNDTDSAEQATANRGLNWPFLTSAGGGKYKGFVNGTLFSINEDYLLQVFSDSSCDALGNGEARLYHTNIGATITNATAGSNGFVQFAIPLRYSGTLNNRAISVTATDSQGNTSELSNCHAYVCDEIFGHGFEGSLAETCPAP